MNRVTSTLAWRSRNALWSSARVGLRRGRADRWLYLVAGGGWVVMAIHTAAVAGGVHSHGNSTSPDFLAAVGAATLAWAAMVVATMLPLVAPNARHVALRAQRPQRRVLTVQVVVGWGLAWAVASAGLAICSALLIASVGQLTAVVVAFVLAAGWQRQGLKRRSLARCHRRFAPSLDRAAARAQARRFGMQLGRDCVISCWALMLPMAVLEHHLLGVVPLAAVAWHERTRPHTEVRLRDSSWTVAAIGVVTVAVMLVA